MNDEEDLYPPFQDWWDEKLNFLNFLAGRRAPEWVERQARKDHIDAFGVAIEDGERYAVRAYPFGGQVARKLSRQSLEALWALVVEDGEGLRERLREQAMERFEEAQAREREVVEAVGEMILPAREREERER